MSETAELDSKGQPRCPGCQLCADECLRAEVAAARQTALEADLQRAGLGTASHAELVAQAQQDKEQARAERNARYLEECRAELETARCPEVLTALGCIPQGCGGAAGPCGYCLEHCRCYRPRLHL